MIGIGAKDDIYYIDYYIKTFKVLFPLFPDEEREIHELVGEPATPYFIGVKLKGGDNIEIFYTQLGKIPPATTFIREIIDLSGL